MKTLAHLLFFRVVDRLSVLKSIPTTLELNKSRIFGNPRVHRELLRIWFPWTPPALNLQSVQRRRERDTTNLLRRKDGGRMLRREGGRERGRTGREPLVQPSHPPPPASLSSALLLYNSELPGRGGGEARVERCTAQLELA